MRTSLLVVTGAYFLTGFQKMVASGPAWVLSDNLRNVMYARPLQRQGTDRRRCPSSSPIARRSPTSWRSSRWSIELGAVVALVRPRLRPAFVVAVAMLHAASTSPTGSTTRCGSATTAVVLIDWDAVLRRVDAAPAACTPP